MIIYIGLTNLQNEIYITQNYIDQRKEKGDRETADKIEVKLGRIVDPADAAINFGGVYNDGTKQENWQNNCDDPLSQAYGGYEYSVTDPYRKATEWAPGGQASDPVIKNRHYFSNKRLEKAPVVIGDVTKNLEEYNDELRKLYGNDGQ